LLPYPNPQTRCKPVRTIGGIQARGGQTKILELREEAKKANVREYGKA